MADNYFNRVIRGEVRDGVANARCVVPGQVAEVTAVDARRVVTFSPGIGELRAGEPVGDGPCPGRPVLYPGGGGWSVTWPLDAGDQALGLAVDRNPERWEANGMIGQAHSTDRPHDVSNVHVLPVTMDAADPGTDYVITNELGEVMRLGLGEVTISTPGPNPTRVASFSLTGQGDIKLEVATARKVIAGDALAEAVTKVQKLLTVLTSASAKAIVAANAIIPPAGDSGAAAFGAFVAELQATLVTTAGTTKLEGT